MFFLSFFCPDVSQSSLIKTADEQGEGSLDRAPAAYDNYDYTGSKLTPALYFSAFTDLVRPEGYDVRDISTKVSTN